MALLNSTSVLSTMPALDFATLPSILSSLWSLFTTWISLFIAPLYPSFHPDILWILIPIWLNFIITEIYLEKDGTNIGNAMQNGLVAAFVGLDWMRSTTRSITQGAAMLGGESSVKFLAALLVFSYGAFVVYAGIKGKRITRRLGRIRGVTYVLAIFTPAVYDLVPLSLEFFLSAILFYPLYHLLVNLLDKRFSGMGWE